MGWDGMGGVSRYRRGALWEEHVYPTDVQAKDRCVVVVTLLVVVVRR